ncbi:MAG: integrase [Rhodanobacteraceae bacterium]|nr:MAG: integrase [Rhodanobacteraceae bacterium]
METLHGADRGTLDYMLGRFETSKQFEVLAVRTQDDYKYCRKVLQGFKTKLGIPFADLRRASITPPTVQRLVDKIAETHPSKANHVARYLSAAYRWAGLRVGVEKNPAKGVQQARERGAHRVPDAETMRALIAFLRERGSRKGHTEGSVSPYLWAVAEIAYRCRMRGIEVRELTDADWTVEGVIVRRHKGSLDNITRWCPELREAWDWLANRRNKIWQRKVLAVPLTPDKRTLLVTESGHAVGRSTLNTAWQRAMQQALKAGVLTAETRFGLHATKHRGVTDTPGTRRDKQDAAGHRSPTMTDVYDPAGNMSKKPG